MSYNNQNQSYQNQGYQNQGYQNQGYQNQGQRQFENKGNEVFLKSKLRTNNQDGSTFTSTTMVLPVPNQDGQKLLIKLKPTIKFKEFLWQHGVTLEMFQEGVMFVGTFEGFTPTNQGGGFGQQGQGQGYQSQGQGYQGQQQAYQGQVQQPQQQRTPQSGFNQQQGVGFNGRAGAFPQNTQSNNPPVFGNGTGSLDDIPF